MKRYKNLALVSAFVISALSSCQSEQQDQPKTDTVEAYKKMQMRSQEDVRKGQAEFFNQYKKKAGLHY